MTRALFSCLLVILPAATVSGAIVTDVPIGSEFLEVEYFAGAGPDTSYLIVDFAATGGDTHAFGFRYDSSAGPVTSLEMIQAIDLAGPLNVDATTNFPGLGEFINAWSFGSESIDDADVPGSFDFWGYYTVDGIPNSSADFGFASVGISTRNVSPNSFDGFAFILDFSNAAPPRIPTSSSAQVPEPSSWICFLVLSVGLFFVRRRKRTASR